MIDRQTIARIKDSADIVDVVSEFVSLRRSGSSYKGLCPFHADSNPSFYVSPTRGTCKCFTCGEGGDAVGFLMKHEQLTYPEALRWLAKRYGIQIEEKQLTDEQRKEQSEREAMFIVNNWAADYYADILQNDVDGRAVGMQYFRQRGFRDDIIRKFKLGFSPSDRHAMPRKAEEKGYSKVFLEKTGLCYPDNKQQLVDRFAGRAIFPWIGVSGNVVAFGGRVLDARTKGVNQKYVNSPDSIIYHKDHELYGIFQAKKAIGKEDCVYMVEGYTDVVSMHQCGIENVVANSGTALSEHQIHLLHRFTSNIVLLYDGDNAGIHAALRGTDMLLRGGMNVKVLLFPDGDDPDSFARKHTAEEFRKYIEENQTDFIEFKTRVLLQGVSDPIKRSEAISSIVKSVSVIADPIVRATYIKDCSDRLGINEQTLINTMNGFIRDYRDEKRKDEERERRRQQNLELNGESRKPASQQAETTPQTASADANGGVPVGGMGVGNDPYADYPIDEYLPDEAFSSGVTQVSGTQGVTGGSTAGMTTVTSPVKTTSPSKSSMNLDVHTLLIQAVVKYGERVILENVETEDGESTTSLNVAQYVNLDLSLDNLSFNNPLYNQILAEAVEHSTEPDFNAEKYFRLHPDYEVSSCAVQLCMEQVELTKTLQMTYDMDTLREHILHLVMEFRWEYVANRLDYLRGEMKLGVNDTSKYMDLVAEYQAMQKVRMELAKKLGRH